MTVAKEARKLKYIASAAVFIKISFVKKLESLSLSLCVEGG
jgi:hypothetical protein